MNGSGMKSSIIYMGRIVQIRDLPLGSYDIWEGNKHPVALAQAPDQIPELITQYLAKIGFSNPDISHKTIELDIKAKKSKLVKSQPPQL